MDLVNLCSDSTPPESGAEPWDFPTLTSENFVRSPKVGTKSTNPISVPLSLAEAFLSYDAVLLFLQQEFRLQSILRNLTFYELMSERQQQQFSAEDPDNKNPARFLRFLDAAEASTLLAAVVSLIGNDPTGRLILRMDNPRVQDLLKQSKGFGRPVNSPKSPQADFYEIKRAHLSRSPPQPLNFSPSRMQPMVFCTSPPTPRTSLESLTGTPLSPPFFPSPNVEMYDMPTPPIRNIPEETADERQFPYSVIRDVETNGSRVILTRTHTIYRESSTRCFVAFNIVFQPNQDRYRRAEISMDFLPIASHKAPVIMNIFPNPDQIWPTGPSCDLTNTSKKFMNVNVGTAFSPDVNAQVGLEKTVDVKSASNSSLTAAGIATSKLTISLIESRAGDGIIYSFAFAVVLDLKNEKKPDFSADLRIRWQLGNRSWFPRHRCSISEKICFTNRKHLDEPSVSGLSGSQP